MEAQSKARAPQVGLLPPEAQLNLQHHEDVEVESICSELENTELTEEETNALLNDALELNKRLKAELRRQEQEDEQHRREGMKSKPGNSSRHVEMSKRGDAKSASLPPIHPNKGLSLNQRRIYNSVEVRAQGKKMNSKPASVIQRKSQSADRHTSQRPASSGSIQRPRASQSAESKQRPEWNDRFSF